MKFIRWDCWKRYFEVWFNLFSVMQAICCLVKVRYRCYSHEWNEMKILILKMTFQVVKTWHESPTTVLWNLTCVPSYFIINYGTITQTITYELLDYCLTVKILNLLVDCGVFSGIWSQGTQICCLQNTSII